MYKILLHPNSCGANLLEPNYETVGEKLVADIVARAASEEFEQQLVECVLDEIAKQAVSEWRRNV